ncbi:RNA polymerase sigma factor [Mangrovibacterium lignilyticum]|uniref:RNA polymerase sigma factor n=1 Tax=Mangrovibacterium lignilyticum TaxID=2668052 RepID=UPI0013CF7F76|nr:RNA polymerase sigma-70 factor [Mangrovibacterium lignilyticum]
MRTDESKLLSNLKLGDHTAFEMLFDQYADRLYQFSLKYLKSKEIAEDVVQEVFMKVWRNREIMRIHSSLQAYLFQITLNAIRKYFNEQAKTNDCKHELLVELSENATTVEEFADYQNLLDKLKFFIDNMPEKRKAAFVKKKIEGKSLKEISEEMKITTKAVEYHITEAMKYLKSQFEELKIQGLIFFHLFLPYSL